MTQNHSPASYWRIHGVVYSMYLILTIIFRAMRKHYRRLSTAAYDQATLGERLNFVREPTNLGEQQVYGVPSLLNGVRLVGLFPLVYDPQTLMI